MIGTEPDSIEYVRKLVGKNKGIAFWFEPIIREEVNRGDIPIIQTRDKEIKTGAIDVLITRED